jgi:hypothetical protein
MTTGSPITIAAPATVTASLFLVPARADRTSLGRSLAAPMLSARLRDHAQAQRGVHPDLIELAPPDGKEKIGIDQVREVIRLAQYSPTQSDRKVCLIPFAERLTPEAANGLLKILEEPPRGLVFALLAEHPSDLLPTLVSRSRVIRVPASGRDATAERFAAAGYSDDDAAWLAAVADHEGEAAELLEPRIDVAEARARARETIRHGGVLDALALALGHDPISRREALIALLDLAAARDVNLLTSGVAHLAAQERAALFTFLQDLLSTCFDLVRDRVRHSGNEASLRPRLGALPDPTLERFIQSIDRAHRALAAYSPADAVLLSLLLSLGGIPDDQ